MISSRPEVRAYAGELNVRVGLIRKPALSREVLLTTSRPAAGRARASDPITMTLPTTTAITRPAPHWDWPEGGGGGAAGAVAGPGAVGPGLVVNRGSSGESATWLVLGSSPPWSSRNGGYWSVIRAA